MTDQIPIVEKFILSYRRHWEKGVQWQIENRVDSSLYFPIRGTLVFEGDFGTILCDAEHPMYIPRNLSYVYHATADTDAYLFNFYDQNPLDAPQHISAVEIRELENAHDQLNLLRIIPSAKNNAKSFSVLYRIMSLAFPESTNEKDAVLLPALEHIALHFNDTSLSLDVLAEKCHISKVYLHKLFVKKLGITPYRYITNARMNRAYILLKDEKSVGQVAQDVGYNDIYTFSRAYKKHFNESPKKTSKK